MANSSTDEKRPAHDPLGRTLASALYDDEPISAREACEVEAAKASLARGEGIPHEEVLAEFGLTAEDFEYMGRIQPKSPSAGQ